MKQKLLFFSLMILFVCFGFSQETGKFGFFFKSGSGNDVGLILKLSNRVTLRPALGFIKEKTEKGYITLRDETTYSMELGLFYHFLEKNHFTAYTGLEMGYSHETTETTLTGPNKFKIKGYLGNVILGFQYNFNKHLAVFGEIGIGLWKRKNDNPEISEATKYTSWSLNRSGFGIILYL